MTTHQYLIPCCPISRAGQTPTAAYKPLESLVLSLPSACLRLRLHRASNHIPLFPLGPLRSLSFDTIGGIPFSWFVSAGSSCVCARTPASLTGLTVPGQAPVRRRGPVPVKRQPSQAPVSARQGPSIYSAPHRTAHKAPSPTATHASSIIGWSPRASTTPPSCPSPLSRSPLQHLRCRQTRECLFVCLLACAARPSLPLPALQLSATTLCKRVPQHQQRQLPLPLSFPFPARQTSTPRLSRSSASRYPLVA